MGEKKARLDEVAGIAYADVAYENKTRGHVIDRCLPHVKGPDVLVLGYAGDPWPTRLSQAGYAVTVIEGAQTHYDLALQNIANQNINIHHTTFEDFAPTGKFSSVIMSNVLGYFDEPAVILNIIKKKFLIEGGRLVAIAPNTLSIHRRIGAILGIEASPRTLNKAARLGDTHHLYDPHSLRATLIANGFATPLMFGCNMKILSSAQMNDWSQDILEALALLSQEMPMEFCKDMIAICDSAS